jgi:hypothetical protein
LLEVHRCGTDTVAGLVAVDVDVCVGRDDLDDFDDVDSHDGQPERDVDDHDHSAQWGRFVVYVVVDV